MRLFQTVRTKIKEAFTLKSVGVSPHFIPLNQLNFIGGFDLNNQRIDDAVLLEDGFVTNTHVFSINKLISLKALTIPIEILDKEKVVDSGDAWDVINPLDKSREDFISESVLSLNTTGDLFYYAPQIPSAKGSTTVLEIWNAGGTTINTTARGDIKSYTYDNGFSKITILPEDVLHIKFLDPTLVGLTSKRGLSPLQAAYMTIIASNNGQKANAAMLKNGGVKGIISSSSGGEGLNNMTPGEEIEIQDVMANKFGSPGKFNSIYTTKATIDYTAIGTNPSDLQILESNVVDMRSLCNVYGVPSQLLNDAANKTHNNQKAGEVALLENAVIPPIEKILREITRFVNNRGNNYSYKTDASDMLVLQEDRHTEAKKTKIVSVEVTAIQKSVNTGELSKNQARADLSILWKMSDDDINQLLP